MGQLILMRHTTPDIAEGICYGRTDLALAASFEAEADAALASLSTAPRRIVSSPLQRCAKLAERTALKFNVDLSIDPALIEMDFGAWEGQAWSDLPRPELDEWAADFLDARPHGGESVRQMRERAQPVLDTLRVETGVLAVTHAGILKVAAHLQDLPDAWRHSVPFGGTLAYG
ncbi:alpha-ribazole phosphatase family protein [Halovulum sp. GXIMD14793]